MLDLPKPPPGTSRSKLAQRRAQMPIIDSARMPLDELKERFPRKGRWLFVWLRVVRPVVFTLFWLLVVRYAWTHFFGLPDELPLWQQVAIYAAAVGAIVLAMLALAPLRRREVVREAPAEDGESTFEDISEYAKVPPGELSELQQAQRLVVHHDEQGQLHSAEDTGKLLR